MKKTITYAPGQNAVKSLMEYKTDACYKIRVCSTKQHITTMFYKVIKDGYLLDLRIYDEYEQIHSEPIALIQVKDGFVNKCCYCDTNVFIDRKKARANSNSKQSSPKKAQKAESYIE